MILLPFFEIPHREELAKNVKSRCVQIIPRSTKYLCILICRHFASSLPHFLCISKKFQYDFIVGFFPIVLYPLNVFKSQYSFINVLKSKVDFLGPAFQLVIEVKNVMLFNTCCFETIIGKLCCKCR